MKNCLIPIFFLGVTLLGAAARADDDHTKVFPREARQEEIDSCVDRSMAALNPKNSGSPKLNKRTKDYKYGNPVTGPYPGADSIAFYCRRNADRLDPFVACLQKLRTKAQESIDRPVKIEFAGGNDKVSPELRARLEKAQKEIQKSGSVKLEKSIRANETIVRWCSIARKSNDDKREPDLMYTEFQDCAGDLYVKTDLEASAIYNSCVRPNAKVFHDCIVNSLPIGVGTAKQHRYIEDCKGALPNGVFGG